MTRTPSRGWHGQHVERQLFQDFGLVAYQLSEGGSDWRSIVIRDVATGDIESPLVDVKFSGINWLNEGFSTPAMTNLTAVNSPPPISTSYFHELGTPQSRDGDFRRDR